MSGKKKYTQSQKKAYYSGMGYGVGYNRKRIEFDSDINKESFRAGFKVGISAANKNSKKYPTIKKKK